MSYWCRRATSLGGIRYNRPMEGLYRLASSALVAFSTVFNAGAQVAVSIDPCNIRAVLSDKNDTVTIGGSLVFRVDGEEVGSSSAPVEVKRTASGVKVVLGDRGVEGERIVAVPSAGYARYNNREYRGRFELFTGKNGGVVLLNVLPLEEYLMGVVPSEMPASWPADALRSQAVAARTYALSRMLDRANETYDVYSTVSDQMYTGVDGEDPRTSQAIIDTAGQIVTFDGKPIVAYYCSDAGGCTKCGTQPYLQSVPIQSPDSPHNDWSVKLSLEQLSNLVSKAGGSIGTPVKVSSEQDPASGHLAKLEVIGQKGKHVITGNKLREMLGLSTMKSTRAWIELPGKPSAKPAGNAMPVGDTLEHFEIDGQAVEIATSTAGSVQGGTVNLVSSSKQWVAYMGGVAGVKLAKAYVSNGSSVTPCLDKVEAYVGEMRPETPVVISTPAKAAKPVKSAQANKTIAAAPKSYSGTVGPEGIVVRGSGYGHGMGLSQWGAKTLAERGMGYQDILAYFYSGVDITRTNTGMVANAGKPGRAEPKVNEQPVIVSVEAPAAHKKQEEKQDKGEFYTPFKGK
jgi:stage II sporulation protein D